MSPAFSVTRLRLAGEPGTAMPSGRLRLIMVFDEATRIVRHTHLDGKRSTPRYILWNGYLESYVPGDRSVGKDEK